MIKEHREKIGSVRIGDKRFEGNGGGGEGQMGQVEQWMYTNWKYSMRKITVLVGVESPEEAGTQQGG